MAIPIAIINPVASATAEQTTEQLAATPEPAAPRLLTATAATATARLTTTQPLAGWVRLWPQERTFRRVGYRETYIRQPTEAEPTGLNVGDPLKS